MTMVFSGVKRRVHRGGGPCGQDPFRLVRSADRGRPRTAIRGGTGLCSGGAFVLRRPNVFAARPFRTLPTLERNGLAFPQLIEGCLRARGLVKEVPHFRRQPQ